ncbi:MAG: biotin transporter BioY [Oscillospiraceae bacterium]|jgi:biotin transport system substrate-specific component|nr:biotin transporter BioY [Oscillospiraceae bacterium]
MAKITVKGIVLCGIFAALTVVGSRIAIPIGAVPVTLATFFTYMAAYLLPPRYAAASQILFIMAAAFFDGGIGALLGPLGGFRIGMVLCAFLAGLVIRKTGGKTIPGILALTGGTLFGIYLFGILWYMALKSVPFSAAFSVCVLPFIPGDSLKIALTVLIAGRIRKWVN